MDVNEEIAKEYYELVENCFVRSGIEYGNYHSAIDLLVINKKGEVIDIEVKWKSRIKICDSDKKQNGFKHFVNQLNNRERDEKIFNLTGKIPDKKVFLTTKNFFGKSKQDYWIKKFLEKNIEVVFFDDIIPKLVYIINKVGKYDSQISQTIRMLKYFNITSENS